MDPIAPPATLPPPRPPRWWLRGLIGTGAALAVAGCVVHFFVLPWVVRRNVASALEGLGFADATFDVRRATPWGTTIGDVVAGGGVVRIASVEVTYGPVAVMSGELERVTLRAAEVRVALRDGKPNWPVRA